MCSVAQFCPTLCDSMDCVACWASLPMEFLRLEYWTGLPFPPPEDLPNPGLEHLSHASSELAGGFFTTDLPGKPLHNTCV